MIFFKWNNIWIGKPGLKSVCLIVKSSVFFVSLAEMKVAGK